ncbi:uncharacterized protein LOC117121024 [Anneissia japonica]|uniref:uncharacterized protein LOC117121024 n=1 Tax=Anneissia japonica TaxID=1529436 RepID=UPI0014256292|nr:uncharacterized protein LOC117121024 [Anneissia japonica]
MSAKKKISHNAVAMTDIASVPVRFPNETQKQMKSADILRKPQPITDKGIKPTCDQFVLDPHPTGAELKMCNLFRHPKISHNDFLVLHVHVDFPGKNLFEFLSNGLLVSQRPYRGKPKKPKRYIFFGHSASQLRNRTCFLYDEKLGDFNDIIQMFGDFSCINNVAKRAARIGLLLSTANEVLRLRDDDITKETDIERDGYNFTDGCGSISVECATRITEAMDLTELYKHQVPPVPSVFQIRLKGCKGVLVVDPKLPKGIKIRNSLEKFSWKLSEPHILGVVDDGISKPYAYGNLIKHFIRILSALGVPDKAFLKLQTSFFEELHQLEKDKWIAIKHLYISGRSDLAERVISMTYDYCSNQEIREKLESIRRKVFDDRKTGASDKLERTKKSKAEGLNIRAELSRNVFGVCDNSNTLEEGTVFFQPTIRGKPVVIKGRVIVAKSPSYYPGDIRVLTCVENKHCRHLVDCVVYPVKGKRPHCDEIAGSDLDGDKYFICWDPDLVPKQHWKPTSYQGGKSKTQSNITTDDLITYFADYNVRRVGKFSNLLEMWADIAGIDSPQCMALANLFNHAIDAAKTGENVKAPKSLMVKSRKGEKIFVCEKMVNNAKCLSGDIKESVSKIEKEMREEYGDESEEFSTFVDAASLVYKASYTAPLDDIDVNNHNLALRRSRSGIKNNWPADDFKLFRMLYKWCQRHEKMNLLSRFCRLIDFSTFTRLQRELAMVDCPDSIEQIQGRHSGLQSSSILSAEDVANLNSETSPTKWSLMYTVLNQDEEIFSWEDILSKMSDDLPKLLVCKFDLGGTWVITIFVPGALELLQTSNDTTTLPDLRAFVSVHGFNSQNCIVNKENVVHAVLLRRSRLQIYPADQSTGNTFICMMEEDGRTKMSVALQNFSSGFKRRYPDINLMREPIISCEIFLGYSDVRQLPTYFVADTDPPELNPEIEPPECPDFLYRQEEFPVVSSSREAHTEHSRTWFQEVDNKYNELKMLAANGTLLNSQLQMLFAMANGDSEEKDPTVTKLQEVTWMAISTSSVGTQIWFQNNTGNQHPIQEKFSWKLSEPHILGVVDDGISKPYAYGNLIKHFIRILSALGVPDKAFLKLQTSFFEELHQLEKDKWIAIKHLYISGRSDLAEKVISMTDDYCSNQEIREKLESIRRKVFDDRKTGASDKLERTKKSKAEGLNIRAELSRNVFGVCDNSNTLEEGTVFFQPTIRGKPVVIKGRVIVAKSPSYYPGDIRVLTCVDNKHCRHLVDCVVYPVKGKRPHCDEIAGSDLDGDKYFICWDPDLVPKQHWKPTSYQGGKSKTQSNITTNYLISYFAYYDVHLVGKFSNLLETWADIAGIDSPQCMALANLFNHAIDAAKTGENVRKVPKSLMVKSRKGEKIFVCEKMVNNAKCLSGDIKESVSKIEKEMREEYGEESEEYSTFVDAASLVYKANYTAPLDDIDVNNHDLPLRRSRSGIVRLLMLRHDLEIREETTVLSNEIMDASEETISSLVQKNNWPADDFKLFRMLYKWCQRHDKLNLLSRFCRLIDFSTFTRLQRELAMVDCPDNIEQIQGRHSGLQSSSILSAEDVANLNSEISSTKWSLMYTVLNQDEEIFSWEDILSKMSDDLPKLLVCKFDLGGTWVITIFVPGALELLQTSNDTTTLPDLRAFVSVHGFNSQSCIVNKENVVHAVLLRRSRLQIYPADQSTRNTFICMMEEDGRTKMSVALQNFSSGFKRRMGPMLQAM